MSIIGLLVPSSRFTCLGKIEGMYGMLICRVKNAFYHRLAMGVGELIFSYIGQLPFYIIINIGLLNVGFCPSFPFYCILCYQMVLIIWIRLMKVK